MSFKPINPKNAISEAVFMVHFIRPLFEHESVGIRNLHDKLKDDFPKLSDQAIQINFIAPNQMPPAAPIEMAVYGPDGGFVRRLSVNGAVLAINELHYTRWEEVSKRAIGYLTKVLDVIATSSSTAATLPLSVRAIGLQIIDRFVWDGDPKEFALNKALVRPFERLPSAVWGAQNPWMSSHTKFETGPIGAIVDKLDVWAAAFPPNPKMTVQIDNILENQYQPPTSIPEPNSFVQGNGKKLQEVYDLLHKRNKAMLRELVVEYLRKQIGIDRA